DPPDREDAALDALIPAEPTRPYDIKALITGVVDEGRFLEVHAHFAPNIVVGFARVAGKSVGIVANQPAVLAGCLDLDASVKGAVNILYRRELARSSDPDALRQQKVAEFRSKFANPYVAADRGFVDEVIYPRQTRKKIAAGLDMTRNKRDRNPPRKHGNIPL